MFRSVDDGSRATRGWSRATAFALGLALASVGYLAVSMLTTTSPSDASRERAVPDLPRPTVAITRQSLRQSVRADCERTVAETAVRASRPPPTYRSVVTSVTEPGRMVTTGSVLAAVAGQPVFAVVGRAVLYRDLRVGSRGSDVLGFERALVDADLIPSADAVLQQSTIDAWRRAVGGVGPVDAITLSSLVMVPPGSRVSRVDVAVGEVAPAGTVLVTVQSRSKTFRCAVQFQGAITAANAALEVDGRSIEIASVRSKASGGTTIADVIVTPRENIRADVAQLVITSAESAGPVLAVPLTAIRTTSDGAAAVVLADGEERIDVRLGVSSQGLVEISSDRLEEGQRVILFGPTGQLPVAATGSDATTS